jgi:hypothetical protein
MACPFALEATMSNTTCTTPRYTLASTNARLDVLADMIGQLIEARTAPEHATTPTVAEVVAETKVEHVTPTKARATTRSRKAKPAEAVIDCATVLTLEDAQTAVDAGVNPWQVKVASSTTGKPIPYGLVLRANKAAEKAAKAEPSTGSAPASTPVSKSGKAAAMRPFNQAMFALMGKHTPEQWAARMGDAELVQAAYYSLSLAECVAVHPYVGAYLSE